METKKILSIRYSSALSGFEEVDDRFDRGVLRIAYHGKNRNMSRISKDSFEHALPTAPNCPIVCRYDRGEDELGGHDVEYVEKDGCGKLVNLTTPVGVIPESANFWWESVCDDSGEHEYLCADALIWKRQEAYTKIRENGITEESMEINVIDGSQSHDGYYDIYDFEFTAFCLLGNVEPCFESAGLELFDLSRERELYSEMLEDMKRSAELIQRSFTVTHCDDNNDAPKGVNDKMDKKKEMMASFGLTEDDLDFSLEDADMDALEEKFEAAKEQKEKEAFSLTAEQFLNEICVSLHEQKVMTEWGESGKWIYIDHDTELKEVYCYSVEDWNVYGLPYSMNGDSVQIDFESAVRKKIQYVDFEEGQSADYGSAIMYAISETAKYAAENQRLEDEKVWTEKYNVKESELSDAMNEVTELRAYKLSVETAKTEEEINGVFQKFDFLNGNELFENLKSDHGSMTPDEIEEKCFAIKGRVMQFSAQPQSGSVRVPTGATVTVEQEPYGGLFLKYKKN